MPTTKEMAAIKVIPLVTANKDIQALGREIPEAARRWLLDTCKTPTGKQEGKP